MRREKDRARSLPKRKQDIVYHASQIVILQQIFRQFFQTGNCLSYEVEDLPGLLGVKRYRIISRIRMGFIWNLERIKGRGLETQKRLKTFEKAIEAGLKLLGAQSGTWGQKSS